MNVCSTPSEEEDLSLEVRVLKERVLLLERFVASIIKHLEEKTERFFNEKT